MWELVSLVAVNMTYCLWTNILGCHVDNYDCDNSGHELWGLFVPHQHFA